VVLLQGAIGFVTFQEEGRLDRVFILSAGSNQMGIDAAPGIYHTFFALKANTVLYEAKSGPFAATPEKDFAPWAPPEGSPAAPGFLDDLVQRVSSTSDGISMKTQ
jgi:cupin fold WbuC family metalloprotein